MTLDDYLKGDEIAGRPKIKEADFAALIGVNQSTVNRLRDGSIPTPAVMAEIVKHTKGAVQPNDFFGIAA